MQSTWTDWNTTLTEPLRTRFGLLAKYVLFQCRLHHIPVHDVWRDDWRPLAEYLAALEHSTDLRVRPALIQSAPGLVPGNVVFRTGQKVGWKQHAPLTPAVATSVDIVERYMANPSLGPLTDAAFDAEFDSRIRSEYIRDHVPQAQLAKKFGVPLKRVRQAVRSTGVQA